MFFAINQKYCETYTAAVCEIKIARKESVFGVPCLWVERMATRRKEFPFKEFGSSRKICLMMAGDWPNGRFNLHRSHSFLFGQQPRWSRWPMIPHREIFFCPWYLFQMPRISFLQPHISPSSHNKCPACPNHWVNRTGRFLDTYLLSLAWKKLS